MMTTLLFTAALMGTFTPADYRDKVADVQRRLAAHGLEDRFHIEVEPPFVVIGDGKRKQVRRRASGTVRWAVKRLKESYFSKDPEGLIEIWLFKDDPSYRTHTFTLFGERPDTPFGYYSERHEALIMNIGTGGGTLVHEIVHPFVDSNFPKAPPWLNEGLGSLYEHSGERDGRIVGYTNWRLANLKEGIRAGQVPSFETLMRSNTHQFYNQDPGTNYAQARYLLYYLQHRGLLRRYYREFHASDSDRTGVATLRSVLGRKDLRAFQKEWQVWVLKLRHPEPK